MPKPTIPQSARMSTRPLSEREQLRRFIVDDEPKKTKTQKKKKAKKPLSPAQLKQAMKQIKWENHKKSVIRYYEQKGHLPIINVDGRYCPNTKLCGMCSHYDELYPPSTSSESNSEETDEEDLTLDEICRRQKIIE